MSNVSMTVSEREAFLADARVGVLAVERGDGPPLATPVWYRVKDGVIEVSTGRDSQKADALAAAGRATITVQREQDPYAYVSVETTVGFSEITNDDRVDIAVRYLGEVAGNAYVGTVLELDEVLVRLTPQRWRTCDYAKLDT